MTFQSNEEQYKGSAFNPFVPTKRDIKRTEKLAGKNAAVAGLLGFFFPIGAMIYLNRASNNLKLIAYIVVINFAMIFAFLSTSGTQSKSDEELIQKIGEINAIGRVVQIFGAIAFMTENARTVTLAKKRLSETDF